MNILFIHNMYLIRGGEDESTEMEIRILVDHGHNVVKYIVGNELIAKKNKLTLAISTIWSHKSYNDVKRIIIENNIHIVHVQNFFPLISPSVYYAAKSLGIPVIQAVRNYRLICPNALFYRNSKICKECSLKVFPYPSIFHKCYRGSASITFVTALMLFIHRILKTWDKKIDKFVVLSKFVKESLIIDGFDSSKIVLKPNFLFSSFALNLNFDDYFIFVGRLTEEKGIRTLCKAWRNQPTETSLKIIGEGIEEKYIHKLINDGYNVEYLGKLPLNETLQYITRAAALIIPSEWYEPFGRVIVESYAMSTPVIASDIGGISELVEDGVTGFLFEPSNPIDLSNKIKLVSSKSKEYMKMMRRKAHNKSFSDFSADINYEMLISIYNSTLYPIKT